MKRKYALDANMVFLFSILASQLLIWAVAMLGVQDTMVLQILIEFFLVVPGIIYLIGQKRSIKESLGINPLTWKQWLLMIPLAICMVNVTEFINMVSQLFATNEVSGHMMDLILTYPFPVVFFSIAIMPMICEEIIFRGVVYQGYRRSGILRAILLSSFLFGIMHMNLNQFCYAFVLGILFCLVNEAVGSFLPSMLMHLFINGRSVVLMFGVVKLLGFFHEQYVEAKAAGDTMMVELIETATEGIPIESEQWLDAYLNTGLDEIGLMHAILGSIPALLISIVGIVLILRYFLKSTGRTEHFRSIFRRKESTEGEAVEKTSVVSVSLLIGCAVCIYFMFAEFIPI